jgi:hypothetical protein
LLFFALGDGPLITPSRVPGAGARRVLNPPGQVTWHVQRVLVERALTSLSCQGEGSPLISGWLSLSAEWTVIRASAVVWPASCCSRA